MSADTIKPAPFVLEICDEFDADAEAHCLSEARKAEVEGNLLLAAAWRKNADEAAKVTETYTALGLC